VTRHAPLLDRRRFLRTGVAAWLLGGAVTVGRAKETRPTFATRGVVLVPEDLTLGDWPERASRGGLTTIALHHGVSPKEVVRTVESDAGKKFLDQCRRLGLQVEYELHAMSELLPRDLFEKDRDLFRMNDKGQRTPDANVCVHSKAALDVIGERATALAKTLRPTTGRYFLWGDDGKPWCHCDKCRPLTDSDQGLILTNHLAKVIRASDDKASVAHLAYANTLAAPKEIKPADGVFLEFAPINRRHDVPYAKQTGSTDRDGLGLLDANLKVFSAATAQVLEYWLDVSRASKWKRPAAKLPWNKEVFRADVEAYATRGIRHVTTFAAWVDAEYRKRFGEPEFIAEYGAGLGGKKD
jgi:Domain of unknown function (DUF4838)